MRKILLLSISIVTLISTYSAEWINITTQSISPAEKSLLASDIKTSIIKSDVPGDG